MYSPEEGSYKKLSVAKHVQAKPLLEKYNEHIKDITTVGGINKSLMVGTVGIGLVSHAKEGGSLGASGENMNGWKPSDFSDIDPKQLAAAEALLNTQVTSEEGSGCLIM